MSALSGFLNIRNCLESVMPAISSLCRYESQAFLSQLSQVGASSKSSSTMMACSVSVVGDQQSNQAALSPWFSWAIFAETVPLPGGSVKL